MRWGFANKRMAWLAWLALALAVVMPVASRVHQAWASIPDLGAWCVGHGTMPPDAPATTEACGYCVWLAQTPWLGAALLILALVGPLPACLEIVYRRAPLAGGPPDTLRARGPPSSADRAGGMLPE